MGEVDGHAVGGGATGPASALVTRLRGQPTSTSMPHPGIFAWWARPSTVATSWSGARRAPADSFLSRPPERDAARSHRRSAACSAVRRRRSGPPSATTAPLKAPPTPVPRDDLPREERERRRARRPRRHDVGGSLQARASRSSSTDRLAVDWRATVVTFVAVSPEPTAGRRGRARRRACPRDDGRRGGRRGRGRRGCRGRSGGRCRACGVGAAASAQQCEAEAHRDPRWSLTAPHRGRS